MAGASHKVLQPPEVNARQRGLYVLEPRSSPATPPTALVIVSHGLGDTAMGWLDTVRFAIAPRLPHVRFVLPTAPRQPVTVNGGGA